ncbi:MAG: SufD family Fe-S cluster assembly protein [Firmicutes bacterium]|nr:SufD family Fe-S cluster assembly protein [Bacillota bacterium]
MEANVKAMLQEVTDRTDIPENAAYNIRSDGSSAGRRNTKNIQIITKTDKPGIDIRVASAAQKEEVFIPALVTHSGFYDLVYNDFYIEPGADVTIIAGCSVCSNGCDASEHHGIHRFFLGENSKVLYLEKHVGSGEGTGERIINPETEVYCEPGSYMEIETTQIRGVDSTNRVSKAVLKDKASIVIREKILTHGKQFAKTAFSVDLDGAGSSARLISRSVATDESVQVFDSKMNGNNACAGHSECDAILMDNGKVSALPEVHANHLDAQLIHEASIGRIAGEQLMKLMSLGLTEKEAEEWIIQGFLK